MRNQPRYYIRFQVAATQEICFFGPFPDWRAARNAACARYYSSGSRIYNHGDTCPDEDQGIMVFRGALGHTQAVREYGMREVANDKGAANVFAELPLTRDELSAMIDATRAD